MNRTITTVALAIAACGLSLIAQAPAVNAPPQQIHADLNQLMRGVLYPTANVVFSAQADNPDDVVKANRDRDPTMATDPLIGAFGGWVAVENAALALAESANLLMIEGRSCSNGVPVPVKDPAWATFVQQVRDASMQSFKAAQAKDQEKIQELSVPLSASCSGCHRKWRDRRPSGNRCK